MTGEKQNGNGTSKLLTVLAQSSNKWVQLATVGLVAFTGLGNWIATWNSADRNKQEIEISRRVAWEGEQRIKQEVVKQVAEMHEWMQDANKEFHQGNMDSASNKKILLEFKDEITNFETRQIAMLNNQTTMIGRQTEILNEISKLVKEKP